MFIGFIFYFMMKNRSQNLAIPLSSLEFIKSILSSPPSRFQIHMPKVKTSIETLAISSSSSEFFTSVPLSTPPCFETILNSTSILNSTEGSDERGRIFNALELNIIQENYNKKSMLEYLLNNNYMDPILLRKAINILEMENNKKTWSKKIWDEWEKENDFDL